MHKNGGYTPEDCVARAEGVLAQLIEECLASAVRPQPFLALGAAVAGLAALAGARYGVGGLFLAAVAPSGAGKQHAPELIARLIASAGLGHCLGWNFCASPLGLQAARRQPRRKLWRADPLDHLLHNPDIASGLMALRDRAKADFVLTGALTPVALTRLCHDTVLREGILSRFLFFTAPELLPSCNRAPRPAVLKAVLREAMRSVARADASAMAVLPAANVRHRDRLDDEDRRLATLAGKIEAAAVSRLSEHAFKLACIRAISRDATAPVLTEDDVDWGWALAEHGAGPLLGPSRGSPQEQALLILREAGAEGLTRSQLYRLSAHLGDQRKSVLDALLKDRRVTVERIGGRTKPTLRYRCADPRL